MPLYDYDCAACGRRIEVVHGVHAPGPTHCPNCGSGPLRKAISAPAVHYKGSGWAKRDRRATVAPGTAKAAGESDTPADPAKGDKEAATGPSTTKGSGSGDQAGDSAASSASSKPSDAGAAAKTGA
jgi:putative FmdB family regulatory protein